MAPVTLELPTGSLADTFGRKWSLAMGGLMTAVAAVLMLGVNDIWLALPAIVLLRRGDDLRLRRSGGVSLRFPGGS